VRALARLLLPAGEPEPLDPRARASRLIASAQPLLMRDLLAAGEPVRPRVLVRCLSCARLVEVLRANRKASSYQTGERCSRCDENLDGVPSHGNTFSGGGLS